VIRVGAYRRISFYVDSATYHVRRVVVLDAQGNRNSFDFGSPRLNIAFTAAEFRFTPPSGTSRVTR
jgi:outer membrane lipoprotein carrier protein